MKNTWDYFMVSWADKGVGSILFLVAIVLIFAVPAILWGRAWNAKWVRTSKGGWFSNIFLVIPCALIITYCIMVWFGANGGEFSRTAHAANMDSLKTQLGKQAERFKQDDSTKDEFQIAVTKCVRKAARKGYDVDPETGVITADEELLGHTPETAKNLINLVSPICYDVSVEMMQDDLIKINPKQEQLIKHLLGRANAQKQEYLNDIAVTMMGESDHLWYTVDLLGEGNSSPVVLMTQEALKKAVNNAWEQEKAAAQEAAKYALWGFCTGLGLLLVLVPFLACADIRANRILKA